MESAAVSNYPSIDWKRVRERVGEYAPEAFEFVRLGLGHTARTIHGDAALSDATPEASRHVSGQQLCHGLKEFAILQYGMLARTVLNRWGIRRTDDFGRIVFAMIELNLMRKAEQDTLDDFRAVYDFGEAFGSVEVETTGRF